MFYMLFHDRQYLLEKIVPLLEGRSEDLLLDFFFMNFAKSIGNADF